MAKATITIMSTKPTLHMPSWTGGSRYSACRGSAGRQDSRDVVVNGEGHNHHNGDKTDLEHGLLHVEAEVSLHDHFDEQHQNDASVENGDGQQVENGQVEADHRHQNHECGGPFAGSFSGELSD